MAATITMAASYTTPRGTTSGFVATVRQAIAGGGFAADQDRALHWWLKLMGTAAYSR
jgi:hypothetical protein